MKGSATVRTDRVPVLEIEGLSIAISGSEGDNIVDDVTLTVMPGETVGLVGESGSGKSLTCLAAAGLNSSNLIVSGRVAVGGRDLDGLKESELRDLRGRAVAMIFQEPKTSLNPVVTIGAQLGEALRHAGVKERAARRKRAIELLDQVGIADPANRLGQYPHELSGGMNQRVMVAIALAGNPSLLIADEPTTALDVTIQAQILDLLRSLVAELEMGLLMVTHDLGVVAETCRRVHVMYGGRVVESGPTIEVLTNPQHPYSAALLHSVPTVTSKRQHLKPIAGRVPTIDAMPAGCRFHPRCPEAMDKCGSEVPALVPHGEDRLVACWARTQGGDDV